MAEKPSYSVSVAFAAPKSVAPGFEKAFQIQAATALVQALICKGNVFSAEGAAEAYAKLIKTIKTS